MFDVSTNGFIPPNQAVPLNVSQLLDFLRARRDPFSVRLVDAVDQLQKAIWLIWNILQQPDELQLAGLDQTNTDGTTGSSLDNVRLKITLGQATALLKASELLLDSPTGSIHLIADDGAGNTVISITGTGLPVITLPTGSQIQINGNKVLTDRQTGVSTVPGTAGGTYTAVEQGMINNSALAINTIIARLQSMGIIF